NAFKLNLIYFTTLIWIPNLNFETSIRKIVSCLRGDSGGVGGGRPRLPLIVFATRGVLPYPYILLASSA
ncbi:hypothetical protein L9F63_014867, partial [Diploptera punctata]